MWSGVLPQQAPRMFVPASSSGTTPRTMSSGCFVVDDFHLDQLRQAGVGLGHHRQAGHLLVADDGLAGSRHVHAGAAVERDDVGPLLFHELGRPLRIDAHHRAEGRAVERDVVGHRADDARRAGILGRANRDAQFFEAGLRFDDDRIGAGVDQRAGLLLERFADLLFREIAVRFHQPAERADVAEDVALAIAEGFADDVGPRPG